MESEATHSDLSPVSRTDFEARSVREVCLQPRFRADWIGVCLFHPAGDKRIMVKQEGNGEPVSGDADRMQDFLQKSETEQRKFLTSKAFD